MNNNINFQYPEWFILLCVLLGIGYAFFLYFRSKAFREQSKLLNWTLGIFRFLTVTFLSILLLSPLIKTKITTSTKPMVVLAQDNSESIIAELKGDDTLKYKQSIQNLQTDLEKDFDVKTYSFGNRVREGIDFSFDDKVSNLSEVLDEVYDLYSNQNLGAIVLASDGIYNEGSNPIYAGTRLNVPIYTVALGDTTPKKDLVLKHVFHNKIAYLGDKFSIQVDLSALNCAGSSTNLSTYLVTDGKTTKLKSENIAIKNNDFFTTKEIILDANRSGVQRYRIALSGINGEVSKANNSKDIFIDVLDARQKILILANAPHPDISALKQTINKNKNYEVTVNYANQLKTDVSRFNFVILHEVPGSNSTANSIISQLNSRKIPHLYIVGSQSNLSAFNQAQSLLNISGNGKNTNDVQAKVANNFNLFLVNESIPTELPKFPPLVVPFGDFKADPKAHVLLQQKIGSVETKYPLLLFGESQGTKMGVLAGEGIWKWRMFNYLQFQNHDYYDELMNKTIQYLSVKEDKRKFRVNVSKNIFNENESILFDAELYNQTYELINQPDARLVITNSANKNFTFTFNRSQNAYTLNAGYFPVGNYRYTAKVTSAGKELSYNGQFSVQPIQLEIFETTADHRLLRILSEKYGGATIAPNDLESIAGMIRAKDDVKPIIHSTFKTRSVIHLKWLFFVLLGLLTVEWFVRRYFGSY